MRLPGRHLFRSVDRQAGAIGHRGVEGHRGRVAGPTLEPGVVTGINGADIGRKREEGTERSRIEYRNTVFVRAIDEGHRQRVGEACIVVRTGIEAGLNVCCGDTARSIAEVRCAVEDERIEDDRAGFVDAGIGSAVERF